MVWVGFRGRISLGEMGTKHGGAGALKAIQDGKPFAGLPAERKLEIQARIESEGPEAVLIDLAGDFVTVADLYRTAVFSAIESGDTDKMTAYIKTWGWINGHAIRALDLVCKIRRAGEHGPTARDVLAAYEKKVDDGQSE